MTQSVDRLWNLLPSVHRQRDAERGYPLRALLQVIGEQVNDLETDIEGLYRNWFIETCDDWAVPYIGALIGYKAPDQLAALDTTDARARALASILAPRRAVANTIANRRRKGTLALLEDLASDVAGWPARAVEFYRLLAWMQPLNHQRQDRGRTADLRDGLALSRLGGAFDSTAHTVDVRRITSNRTPGRHNIPSVGLFVWRLGAYQVTREPAYCLEELGSSAFTFSNFGNTAPLFTKPVAEAPDTIAGPLNVPAPITRHALKADPAAFMGPGQSFAIWAEGWGKGDGPIPPEAVIAADLSGWHYRPPRGHVAVDPELGRIAFAPREAPKKGVWARYHRGFSADMGGGEYPRVLSAPEGAVIYRVGEGQDHTRIGDALTAWRAEAPTHAIIELTDGGVYTEQINIELGAGQSLQLRAANRTRAILRMMDWHSSRPDALWVRGEKGSRFTLDGIVVLGRSVQCEGPLAEIAIRHATLVPGWTLDADCQPSRPAEPGLELIDCTGDIVVAHTILGSIQVSGDEVDADPARIAISDSILDATSDEREAIGAPSWPLAHAVVCVARTTVIGTVQTHAIELAEDSIFIGTVRVGRRQIGCMRFCYVPKSSRTPRRYRCQPDLAEAEARAAISTQPWSGRASVPIQVDGDPEDLDATQAPRPANLALSIDTTNPTPKIGEMITLTVRVENTGPRTAADAVVRIEAPVDRTDATEGCLKSIGDPVTSQGEFITEPNLIWKTGPLSPGKSASLTAVLEVTGHCVPAELSAGIQEAAFSDDGAAFTAKTLAAACQSVVPRFTDTRYGRPGYGQLDLCTDDAILRGASDEAEMGAFHDLYQPQRTDLLAARLDDFTPAGHDAGILFAN